MAHANVEEEASLTPLFDYVLPAAVLALTFLLFLILSPQRAHEAPRMAPYIFAAPLIICAFFFARPLRFGLAVAAVLIVSGVYHRKYDRSLYADRSYFGIIRVSMSQTEYRDLPYMQLTHGHINHGMNILKPEKQADWGDANLDFSRLATTYYHRLSPVGVAMEKFNWNWEGPANTFHADGRLPASLIGGVSTLGTLPLPVDAFAALWSEPAFATIGLGTGTMASYGRPYQHVHYYEIDNHIRRLNLPLRKNDYYFSLVETPFSPSLPEEPLFVKGTYQEKGHARTYFTYLKDAIRRGCDVQVFMGDARLRMALPYRSFHADPHSKAPPGGPEGFYHLIVVDAFSSDAIPVHLLTKESFKMYFDHMAEDGVLCVHTSSRFVRLPLVVAAVANDLGFSWRRGHTYGADQLGDTRAARDVANLGRYSSEWVMVAKHSKHLAHLDKFAGLKVPPGKNRGEPMWSTPTANPRYMWTDDHSNLMNVLGKREEDD